MKKKSKGYYVSLDEIPLSAVHRPDHLISPPLFGREKQENAVPKFSFISLIPREKTPP